MNLLTADFLLSLLILSLFALLFVYKRNRASRKALEDCSDLLQEIFKMVDETSSTTRILSQETPKQELKRLKYLLESKTSLALRENGALRRVLNNFPDGLVALDAERNVLFCNPVYCELMSVPMQKHEGKKLFEILRHHVALAEAEKFLNQEASFSSEVELVTSSEKTLRMRMICERSATPMTTLFVFSDVSNLKKLEAMRRDFVANVSHELRTPLTSIYGFIETLLAGAGEDVEARNKFLNLMKSDSERLRRLIEDLLTLSRIESQTRDFEKQTLDVENEIDSVLELFELRKKQKNLNMNKKIEADLTLNANRDQFRQVLINLLDNAVKFTPEKGSVGIVAKHSENKTIEISIFDSGVGIHPDNHEKVFQRFFREDKARSRETGGTGLGLSIVKHIMEAHGGQVRCEVGPENRGSMFTITFPR